MFSDYRLGRYIVSCQTLTDVMEDEKLSLTFGEMKQLDSLIFVDDDFPLNTKIISIYTDIRFLKKIDIKINNEHLKVINFIWG